MLFDVTFLLINADAQVMIIVHHVLFNLNWKCYIINGFYPTIRKHEVLYIIIRQVVIKTFSLCCSAYVILKIC